MTPIYSCFFLAFLPVTYIDFKNSIKSQSITLMKTSSSVECESAQSLIKDFNLWEASSFSFISITLLNAILDCFDDDFYLKKSLSSLILVRGTANTMLPPLSSIIIEEGIFNEINCLTS